jgi:PhzF family phenazine biosynthesis protein
MASSSDTTKLDFSTVDVFTPPSAHLATSRYSDGNPLAIVRLAPHVNLTHEQKQLIAREFNYSETVFLHEPPLEENCWKLDIFTTFRELPFAGHPTIGTASFIMDEVARLTNKEGFLEGKFIVKAGEISLKYDVKERTAFAQIPHNFHTHKATCDSSELYRLQPGLVQPPRTASPIVSIVRGMTFALIELQSLDSLGSVAVTPLLVSAPLDDGWESFVGQYLYYHNGVDTKTKTILLRTRMIAKGWEDPATGSAACTLACHLSLQARGAPNQSFTYEITQGVEMKRKCVIKVTVRLSPKGSIQEVLLAGKAVEVMNGTLRVPVVDP